MVDRVGYKPNSGTDMQAVTRKWTDSGFGHPNGAIQILRNRCFFQFWFVFNVCKRVVKYIVTLN